MGIERLAVLLGACALLWILESRWPLFGFGHDRARHALPNLGLAALTVFMNLGFASALRPAHPGSVLGNEAWPSACPHGWIVSWAGSS